MSKMKVELLSEEVGLIADWYNASAGESAHDVSEQLFALLEKLGIPANFRDLYQRDPDGVVASHRPVVESANAAIRRYRTRHAGMKVVRDVIDQEETAGLSK